MLTNLTWVIIGPPAAAFSHDRRRKSIGFDAHYSSYRYTTVAMTQLTKRMTVDAYVVETLMPDLVGHDGQPSAFLVYLYLWAQARGLRSRFVPASYAQIAFGTGLSRSVVQAAVTTLKRRQLL